MGGFTGFTIFAFIHCAALQVHSIIFDTCTSSQYRCDCYLTCGLIVYVMYTDIFGVVTGVIVKGNHSYCKCVTLKVIIISKHMDVSCIYRLYSRSEFLGHYSTYTISLASPQDLALLSH